MKKIISILILTITAISSNSQVKSDDFGRIILNTYLPENIVLPTEAKSYLQSKLSQIATNNGIGGSQANPRFIITANINIGTKDIIAGPPQMIAQNVDVILFIGDAVSNTIFSNTTISLKGVGANENKALIEAFKTINPKTKEVSSFLEEGKNKIIDYYNVQCDFIIKQATTLAEQYKFEEAIYALMTVPETCKDCYFKSKDEASHIFKKKIEKDCAEKVKQAKLAWASEPTEAGANKAAAIMSTIVPSDYCKAEIIKLSDEIKKKLLEEQKKKYDFEMYEMRKKYDTEQKRLDAILKIAVEQAKNQPQIITYSHIYWR